MIVREGLTPVGHGKPGVYGLGFAKGEGGIHVLEIVEQRQAVKKSVLRRGRAGVRKLHITDLPVLRRQWRRRNSRSQQE
jgi:hypothetical protein